MGSPHTDLAQVPPFSYMESQVVAEFASAGRVREYGSGDQIYHEAQHATTVLVVLRGVVYVCTYETDGRRVVEAVMAPVESFGWMSLVRHSQRTLNAVVGGEATLFTVARRDVLGVLERHPRAWRAVARFLAERMGRTLANQRALAGFALSRRIAFVLCQAFRIGIPGTACLAELALTQEDVASMAATSRQSVNRQLGVWARAGVVDLGYHNLRVLQPEVLLRQAAAGNSS